jgi:hypothetical protein
MFHPSILLLKVALKIKCVCVCACVRAREYMKHWWNYTDRVKESTRKENWRSATVSTTNHIGTDLGLNTGLCGQKDGTQG